MNADTLAELLDRLDLEEDDVIDAFASLDNDCTADELMLEIESRTGQFLDDCSTSELRAILNFARAQADGDDSEDADDE